MTPSTHKIPNFFWSDQSGYCFDLPPRHVIAGWGNVVMGGPYDIPSLPDINYIPTINGWTNWVDKFWKDYRFANLSDLNAVANIYPEVQDPWMFTEYVYQGTQKENAKDNSTAINKGIVEPPLARIDEIPRSYTFPNNHPTLTSAPLFFNDQPATVIPLAKQNAYGTEYQWKSTVSPFNVYWESDLKLQNWIETLPGGQTNSSFTRLPNSRRMVKYANVVVNSGVRLYRHPVWASCTRWGESGNIPERAIGLSAPREYFTPDGLYTGRIVPQVSIESGVPLYDNVTHSK